MDPIVVNIVIGILLTALSYMLVPVIFILYSKVKAKKFREKQINTIVIANGIIVFAIFSILNFLAGEAKFEKIGLAILWSGVNRVLLNKYCLDKSEQIVEEKTTPAIKTVYVVNKDIPAGKHTFIATNPEGGIVRILTNDNTLLDRIYVKKKKKINLKSETVVNAFGCIAESYTAVEDNIADTNKICFCRKCGERLIDNSSFCRKCGTEIVDVSEK